MKKIILLVLLSLPGLTKINAQDFRFGIYVNPTFNYLSTNDPAAETGLDMMFGLGLLAEYNFSENYSVASGVNVLFRRGGEMTLQDTTGHYKSGFVQIPLTLKLRTREFGYFTYFATFGGDIAIETDERTEFEPEPADRLKSYVRPFNLNFHIGGGVEYALGGSTKLFTEISYHRSLIDNLDTDNPWLDDQYIYRFDYVGLSVGVIF